MTVSHAHLLALLNFTHFVASAGYGAIFILCLLQSCCVPTSSELTMGLAGALAAQGKLSIAAVILVGTLGEVVGAYIAWMVGRSAGRAAVDRFGRYILVSHRDLDRAEAWYERHERFGVFGSRLLPVIRNFVAVPAGIAEVPLLRFGLLTAGGSLLWDGAWAGVGYGVGAHWHTIAKAFGVLGYGLAVVAVGVIAFAGYHRYKSYKEGAAAVDEREVHEDGLPRHPRGRAAAVRWVGGSTGRPPEAANPVARLQPPPDGWSPGSSGVRTMVRVEPPSDRWASGPTSERRPSPDANPRPDRWLASSSGRPQVETSVRHRDFPNSPLAAWEAAVTHGHQERSASPSGLLDGDDAGVEGNGRLTAMLGVLLLVLLAIEGATILRVGPLLTWHVVVGMILVPVILLKVGSTSWRFAKYYLGSSGYRRRGPPPALLRLLGPFVVATTVAVIGTGIALLLAPASLRNELLLLHKVTFVLWFAAMTIHVLGHLLDMARLAPRDFSRRTRRQIRGAGMRQWAIVSAVCIGILLGVAVAPKVGPWLAGRHKPGHKIAHVNSTASTGSTASSTHAPQG